MSAEELKKENRMGTEKMSRLVIATGIPLMVSLLINSLYNFVDSVFVSRISEDALTALSLAAPVQILVSSLGLGNAVGLNAAISKSLGEKRPDKVKKSADAAIFLAICAGAILAILCVLFVKPYFVWQAGGNAEIAAYGQKYLTVCMLFSFGQMGQWVFDRFVMASGKPHLFLFTLSAASLTNLILDPIFIFGLFGMPRLETLGAAIATVIGQITGMAAGILINLRWNKEIPFSVTWRPDQESILAILKVGLPSTLVQILTSVVGVAINSMLFAFSSTAVAVYGICIKIQSIVTVGVHGIDNGMIPIVAYHYGAKRPERIEKAVKWALFDSALLYLAFFIALTVSPDAILRLFDASDSMLAAGEPALRIFAVAWFLSIPNLVIAASLQGLSMGTKSMYLTMSRQAVFTVLLILLFCQSGNLNLIWSAFALSECLAVPLAFYLWKKRPVIPAA